MTDLVALFNKVSALKPAERKILASKTPKKTLPALGGIAPPTAAQLLSTEFVTNSEWYIPPDELERIRTEAKWKRVRLELHTYKSTCKCCGTVQYYDGDTFVFFEHKTLPDVTRRVNKEHRSDQTDLLLPRATFQHEVTPAYCSSCFTSAKAEIEAWEAQLPDREKEAAARHEAFMRENNAIVEKQEAEERKRRAEELSNELRAYANEVNRELFPIIVWSPPWYEPARSAT